MPSSVREWRRLYRAVKRRVATTNADAFHALERYPYASDIRTVQWTSDMVVVWRRTGLRPPVRSLAGEVVMNWLSRRGATSAELTVAQSPETAAQMRWLWRLSPDQIVPLGVHEEFRSEPDGVSDRAQVLLVGRIGPRKGQRRVLRHMDPDNDAYDVRIVGSIQDEAYAQSALEGWRDRHLGYVSDAELERQYERADVVVVPSNLETFSMVGLEALAKGCALVITADCGLAQFEWSTPENGMFVADDGEHAVELLHDCCGSPTLADAKRAAYELTADLTWDRIAERYVDIYRTVA